MKRLAVLVGLLLVSLLLVAGCSSSSSSASSSPTSSASTASTAALGRYVALGDSYTAAPYVYLTDLAKGCVRSDHNYPSLLAKRIDAHSFVDVSCSGATTVDVRRPQRTVGNTTRPAQIHAVTRDTDLVTIGMGGNDNGLFASLVGGCYAPPGVDRVGASCGQVDVGSARSKLAGLEQRMSGVLRLIRARAPHAQVFVVGYPRIVAPDSTCATLPLAASSLPAVDALTRALNGRLRAAADAAHASYVDVYAASRGHDICAGKQAWINGVRLNPNRAAPFHPFAAEQAAVARLIAAKLG